ncbi:MAG TPA: APC family permease [Anaerolineales bacterium]|nr:APC family permease [Anaerolineales bacterium]
MTDPEPPPVIHRPAEYRSPSILRSWLIGRPLSNADESDQAIRKRVALAVFASDALSSTAYATQEILLVLAAAGTVAFGVAFPIAIAIVGLLAIVTFSYQQTIHAYPEGGGAYIVARDNLGTLPAQVAGAALLTDYILTVAVSVSAGVAQLVSAYPALRPERVWIAVGFVLLIMIINLRGVRESGAVFAIPTYYFLATIGATVVYGLVRAATGTLGPVTGPPPLEVHELQALTAFLVLRAFSSGTTALTGVEAISNGITAFREPRSKNAAITLVWMSVILGTLFLAITYLALIVKAVPSESETVISQLVRTIFGGRSAVYLAVIGATTLILVMAANTAFAGFPRLGALMAVDRFLPRQFSHRGSRLVYSWGIVILAVVAGLLIVLFRASVSGLIPLYAIGVFLSFTLSQSGMARRWVRIGRLSPDAEGKPAGSTLRYDPGWRWKSLVNAFGAVCTFVVMMIFSITKFTQGAWLVLIIIPAVVLGLHAIHKHYTLLAERLSLEDYGPPPVLKHARVLMPIAGVHRGTLAALRYAQAIGTEVTALHVSVDEADTEKVWAKWRRWGEGVPLVIIDSPYRALMQPLVSYIAEAAHSCEPGEVITVVVPEFVPAQTWENLLHMQTAAWLRWALLHLENVVVVDVPYVVE